MPAPYKATISKKAEPSKLWMAPNKQQEDNKQRHNKNAAGGKRKGRGSKSKRSRVNSSEGSKYPAASAE